MNLILQRKHATKETVICFIIALFVLNSHTKFPPEVEFCES